MDCFAADGNYYANFRYESSSLGRFFQPDPVGGDPTNPQSWNRYAYALNSPVNLIDPFGLDTSSCGSGTEPGVDQVCNVNGDTDVGWAPIFGGGCCASDGGPGLLLIGPFGGGGDGGGGGGNGGGNNAKPQPQSTNKPKMDICQLAQRGRLLGEAGINYLLAKGKIGLADESLAAAPLTFGLSVIPAAGLTISAAGNFTAASAQLAGAISGNVEQADTAASMATTATSITGPITLILSGGNMKLASTVSSFESLFTTGYKGGKTGQLIEAGLDRAGKLLAGTEFGQNVLEAAGIEPTCKQ